MPIELKHKHILRDLESLHNLLLQLQIPTEPRIIRFGLHILTPPLIINIPRQIPLKHGGIGLHNTPRADRHHTLGAPHKLKATTKGVHKGRAVRAAERDIVDDVDQRLFVMVHATVDGAVRDLDALFVPAHLRGAVENYRVLAFLEEGHPVVKGDQLVGGLEKDWEGAPVEFV